MAVFALMTLGNLAGTVKADLILSIDLDPAASGIQNTLNLQGAIPFQVDLYLELDNLSSLDSYRASVQFDVAGIQYVDSVSLPLQNYSIFAGGLGVRGDLVGPFEAVSNTFGAGLTAPFGPMLIGSLTFKPLAPGQFLIAPFEDPQLDGSYDSNFNQLVSSLRGGVVTISSVPEPNCLALLGIGLATSLLSHRSRKRQQM